jgi:formate hydrogenlyase subunit 4
MPPPRLLTRYAAVIMPAGWLSLRQLLRHYAISSVLLFSLRHIFAIAAFRHAISTMRDVAA